MRGTEYKHVYALRNKDTDNYLLTYWASDSELQEVSYDVPEGFNAEIKDDRVVIKKTTFKVGDWITTTDEEGNVTTEKIIEFWGDKVRLIDTNGFYSLWPKHELNYYHIWTINDAKDGDVLVTDETVFIYAKVLYNKPYAYCGVDKFGVFKDNCLENNWSNSLDNIYPATKEQRDLLFQKMKNAGYEWDAEKKELKKIEPKKLAPDKVIGWLVANICDFEYYVKLFKKDFGL